MEAPDFWGDKESAHHLVKEKAHLEKSVDNWNKLEKDFEDLDILITLSETEEGASLYTEIDALLNTLAIGITHLEIELMLSGDNDINNAIVSIHPGAGGTESQDWAEMLFRMYTRWAEKQGYKVEVLDYQPADEAGIKGVTFAVNGDYAYGYLKAEAGVHRLVRISPFDANKRRHTSFSSVFVYPEIEEDIEITINDDDLRIDTYRASSAGGQHVNKTDSAVRITHIPTGIVTQCQNERSQLKNKQVAMKVLKAKLYELQQREKQEKLDKITGEKKGISWGSQIRSYIFQPYQMVKDHRTNIDIGNVQAVMDGDIDNFIEAYLMAEKGKQ